MPQDWYDKADFARTAESFRNRDWAAITLHDYRSRWRAEPVDPRYAAAQATIEATAKLDVPTLLIVGRDDRADYPKESEGDSACFPAGYRRVVLDGVGHFPAREAPDAVVDAIAAFLVDEGIAVQSSR